MERLYINDIKALAKHGTGSGFEPEEEAAFITVGLMMPKLKVPHELDPGNIHGFEEYKNPSLRHEFTRHAKILAEELFDTKLRPSTVTSSN